MNNKILILPTDGIYQTVDGVKLKTIPSQSEQNFLTHGMDKPFELDMSTEVSTRAFIEQAPTVLGSGKVFKKSIDTSKIPIKKVSIE